MKVLFDTSVLISALVDSHVFQARALPLLDRAQSGEFEWYVSQHTVAEIYRVLTSMKPTRDIPTSAVGKLLEENIFTRASVVSLSPDDYRKIISRQAELGNRSGAIFDALIAHAAQKVGAERLYTFNPDHFLRVWPEGAGIVTVP
jgi:predicted nucleic acid-binding protein